MAETRRTTKIVFTKTSLRAVLLFGTLSSLLLCSPASAQTTAESVLAATKTASGGAAWDRVTNLHTVSSIQNGGLTGTQEEWDDVLTGRYSVSSDLGPASQRDGYDGTRVWNQDENGQSRYVAGTDDVQAAYSTAYRVCFAYWFPRRFPGTVSYLKHTAESGRSFDVLQIAPHTGRPFQFWVDDKTHLPDRTIEPGATQTDTTFFSDYRPTGGLVLPFGTRASTGDPRYDTVSVTQSVVINAAVPNGTFTLPPPPPPDFAIAGNAASVTVPFEYSGAHILVPIKINGQGPFQAVLDTGGRYVLTPALARHVGLRAQGALAATGNGADTISTGLVRADTISVGRLILRRPLIYVLNLPALRDHPIIGFELFNRFTTRIDYDKLRVTFTVPTRFVYHGTGVSVPFRFNNDIPEVDGKVDGLPGVFTIDTGAGDSLRLNRPFVEAHGLRKRYQPRYDTIIGYGTGGPERGGPVRLGRLSLGGIAVNGVQASLTTAQAGGGADKAVAGNVGEGFLHRFNLTFDYARMRIFFERNSHYGEAESESRTGIALDPNAPNVLIADVVPGSPAARAGIKVGDVIETVNGRTMVNDAFSPLYSLFLQPAGTRLRLRVTSGKGVRSITLVLRDLE